MHNRCVVVSRFGILDSYHSAGPHRSLHTNDLFAQSDWPVLAQSMGMSVTSRDSSCDGFRSFGNKTPKLMKMAFSDVEEFRAAFL